MFLITSKTIYEGVLTESTDGGDPSVEFNEVTAAVGTTLPFTVAATPLGIMYSVPNDGPYLFTRQGSFPFGADSVGVLFRGQNAENYQAFTPVWGAYGRGEYFTGDAENITMAVALGVIGEGGIQTTDPGTWRGIGATNIFPPGGPILNTLYYMKDTKQLITSFGGYVWEYEVPGVYSDGLNGIIFEIQTISTNLNEGQQTLTKRFYIDIASWDAVTPTIVTDQGDYALPQIPSTEGVRTIVEIPYQVTARIIGVRVSGRLYAGMCQVYEVSADLIVGA